jgi:hypothetical protein
MKKPLLLLTALSFVVCFSATAQNLQKIWESYFDGALDGPDQSRCLLYDPAGNVFITGTSYNTNSKGNFTTLKYDASGNQLWETSDNGTQTSSKSEGRKLVMDKNGMVYGVGTLSYNSGDLAIIKYDADGKLWAKNYEPYWFGSEKDFGVDIGLDSSGNVYAVAQITSLSGNLYDLYVIKTDSGGNKIYEDDYTSASDDDYAEGVAVSPAGIMYVLASCFNFFGSGTYDIHTIKYLDNGNQDWLSKYDGAGSGSDYGTCIKADAEENTYVCGIADAGSTNDMIAYKQNLYGTRFWTVTYNGTANSNDTAVAIDYLPNGLVAVTGNSLELSGSTNKKAIVTMLIDSGIVLWTKTYSGTDGSGAFAKALTTDAAGNIYVCGYENSASGNDAVILKYSEGGDLLWKEIFDGATNLDDRFNSLVVDDSLNIIATGQSFTSTSNANYVTVKYSQENVATSDQVVDAVGLSLNIFPNPGKRILCYDQRILSYRRFGNYE